MSYIMLISLSSFPILLTNISSLIVSSLKLKFLAKTQYERDQAVKPEFMKYHSDYPKHLLVFMIGLAYAPLAPLLVPFVTIFFATAKLVFRFRLVYLMPVKCDGGGALFPLVFNRVIVGLYVAQITLLVSIIWMFMYIYILDRWPPANNESISVTCYDSSSNRECLD